MQKSTSPETLLSLAAKISSSLKSMHDKALGNITSAQFRVLGVLAKANGDLTQQAIVRDGGIDRATLSEMLPRMRSAGLLTMWTNPEDGRSRLVAITTAGRDEYRRAGRSIAAVERHIERKIPRLRETLQALIEFA